MKIETKAIRRIALLYSARNINRLITRQEDINRLLQSVCNHLVETYVYANAWLVLSRHTSMAQETPPTSPGTGVPRAIFTAGLGSKAASLTEYLQRGAWPECGQRALEQTGVYAIKSPTPICTGCPLLEVDTGHQRLCVRLEHADRVYGLLSVSLSTDLVADEEERLLLTEMADDLAFALHNIELEQVRRQADAQREAMVETLKRRTTQLELLNNVGNQIVAKSDLDTLLERATRLVQETFGYYHVALFTLDREQEAWIMCSQSGHLSHIFPIGHRLKLESKTGDWTEHYGKTLLLHNVNTGSPLGFYSTALSTYSELRVPIQMGEMLLGVLDVQSPRPNAFDENDILTLEVLADQLAVAIENARLCESARRELSERELAVKKAHQRNREMTTLHQMALDLTAQQPLTALLQAIPDRAAELLQAKTGVIYLYRPASDDLEIAFASKQDAEFIGTILQRGESIAGKVLANGESLIVDNYSRWEGRSAQYNRYTDANLTAGIAAPIIGGDRIVGILSLWDDAPRTFSPDDVTLLERLASLVAITLENSRLLEIEREQHQIAGALRLTSLALSSTLDYEQVLNILLTQIGTVIPYDNVNVIKVEAGIARITHQRSRIADGMPDAVAALRLPLAESPALQHVAATRQPHVIPDTQTDPDWAYPEPLHWVRSWACAPIIVQDEVSTFFSVDSATPGFYTERHGDLLAAFAAHAGIAIENAQLYKNLQQRIQELRDTQAQLIQTAKLAAVGELAAGIAYEINNPLTSVLGFADLLARDPTMNDVWRGDLQAIISEARCARDIVRDLLHFAHQTPPYREPADVNALLQQTLAIIRTYLASNYIDVQEDYAPNLGDLLLDIGQMKQVFLNLLTNAMQAMPEGGTLRLSTVRRGNEVLISIADTGVGIPPASQEHIFDPFFTTNSFGTGLGLSVSLGIVQSHGGHITVESQEVAGSVFTVWLPVKTMTAEGTNGQ